MGIKVFVRLNNLKWFYRGLNKHLKNIPLDFHGKSLHFCKRDVFDNFVYNDAVK